MLNDRVFTGMPLGDGGLVEAGGNVGQMLGAVLVLASSTDSFSQRSSSFSRLGDWLCPYELFNTSVWEARLWESVLMSLLMDLTLSW